MLGYKVFGAGIPGLAVQALCQDVATSVSATGTTQGTATALTSTVNYVGTVGASSGVILFSTATAGDSQVVYNGGANPVRVYPPVGARINGLSTNAAAIISINTAVEFHCISATQWIGVLSA